MRRQEPFAIRVQTIESSLPSQAVVVTQIYRSAIVEMKAKAEPLLTSGKHEPAELTGSVAQQTAQRHNDLNRQVGAEEGTHEPNFPGTESMHHRARASALLWVIPCRLVCTRSRGREIANTLTPRAASFNCRGRHVCFERKR